MGKLVMSEWVFGWSLLRGVGSALTWSVDSSSEETAWRIAMLLDDRLFRRARVGAAVLERPALMSVNNRWVIGGKAWYSDELWDRVGDFASRMDRASDAMRWRGWRG